MISGFLTSVIEVPPTTPAYRGTPYVPVIDFPTIFSGFFSSEAFDKANQSGQYRCGRSYARYISEIAIVRRSQKVTNELGDNGAHRCVSAVYKTRRHYICREGTPLQTQGIARCLVPLRENGDNRSCFSSIFMSYPQ